ncbi:hypothetical protein DMC30DRAFT_416578 [Rhodotorula diobovata]|uniref:Uncharacterized protein n=1 Tax=Rhodotorula diobovata TaxID=5288 RepID=A0A5C5FYS0_9BASI|nr:hypothetical protein DMC30DRAFT_416578 [Rhodotorula diobovata]
MAKHAPVSQEPSKPWLKLVVTLVILAALGYAAKLALAAINESINSAKSAMEKKGVQVSSSGASVKTNKRALTQEETEDRIQRGIMKGWKASSFNVPWALGKVSNLSGSTHDKNREEHEKKYGPKKSKARVD